MAMSLKKTKAQFTFQNAVGMEPGGTLNACRRRGRVVLGRYLLLGTPRFFDVKSEETKERAVARLRRVAEAADRVVDDQVLHTVVSDPSLVPAWRRIRTEPGRVVDDIVGDRIELHYVVGGSGRPVDAVIAVEDPYPHIVARQGVPHDAEVDRAKGTGDPTVAKHSPPTTRIPAELANFGPAIPTRFMRPASSREMV